MKKLIEAIKNLPGSQEFELKDLNEDELNDVSKDTVTFDDHMKGMYDPSFKFRKNVIDSGFKIKKLLAVYYQGWESDEWACIATKDGSKYKITTNHGQLIFKKLECNCSCKNGCKKQGG